MKALEASEIIQDVYKTDNNQSDLNDVIQAMSTSISLPYVTVTNVLQARLYIPHSYQVIQCNCNDQPSARLLAERVQMLNKEMQPFCYSVINPFVGWDWIKHLCNGFDCITMYVRSKYIKVKNAKCICHCLKQYAIVTFGLEIC